MTFDEHGDGKLNNSGNDEVEVLSDMPEYGALHRYSMDDGSDSYVNYNFSCQIREAAQLGQESNGEEHATPIGPFKWAN